MVRSSIFAAISIAISAVAARAEVVTGPIVRPATGSIYYLLQPATWTASESEAVSLGGNLVTINNAGENQYVYETFARAYEVEVWLGLNDQAEEGTFVWSSGQPVTYLNWEGGETGPSPTGPGEDYVHMYDTYFPPPTPSLWNDVANDRPPFGVPSGLVEITPLAGDADLNRNVGFSDLLLLARNYGRTTDATWLTGDFDESGTVNFGDLLTLARNYGDGTTASALATGEAAFDAQWRLAQSLVPEPTSAASVVGLMASLVRRRRTRRDDARMIP